MLLRKFSVFLLRILRAALRWPKTILLLSTIAFLSTAVLSAKVPSLTSIDDIVDDSFKTTASLQRLKSLFDDRNSLLILFSKKDGSTWSERELCAISKWGASQSAFNPSILKMLSPFQIRRARLDGNLFGYPALLQLDCEGGTDRQVLDRLDPSPWKGLLTARGEGPSKDFILEFSLADSAHRDGFPSFDPSVIDGIKADLEKNVLQPYQDIQAEFSGLATFQYYTSEGYRAIEWLNLAIVAVLLLFTRLFFGSFRGTVILASTLIFSTTLVKGLMGALGLPLDLLSNNLLLMVTVACIEDFIFLSYAQYAGSTPWRTGYRRFLVPSFFTSFTTALGFLSLGVSDLGIIRRFGLLVGIAAMVEWLTLFLLLPCFVQVFPRWRVWVQPEKAVGRSFFFRFSQMRAPRGLARLALLVFPLAAFATFHLKYLEIPENTFAEGHPVRHVLDRISASRGFRSQVHWIFESSVSDQKIRQLLTALKTEFPDLVAHVEDPLRVEDYIYEPVKGTVADEFRRDFRQGSGSSRWIAKSKERRAILFLATSETGAINRLRAWTEKQCGSDCFLAGTIVSFGEFGDRVRATLLESLWVSLLLVGLILVFLIRQRGHSGTMAILASSFWGPLVLIVGLWAFQFPIYFITCLFAATLVGMAGDNAIQYLWARPRQFSSHTESLGPASQLVTLSMISVALCFLGAYFAPARTLGLLVVGGVSLSFVGDYFLLLSWLDDPLFGAKRGPRKPEL